MPRKSKTARPIEKLKAMQSKSKAETKNPIKKETKTTASKVTKPAKIIEAKKPNAKVFVPPDRAELPKLRAHQLAAREAYYAGKRRQFLAWHRRAGKDFFGMQLAAEEMERNPGSYWHMFPTHTNARRAIWNGRDPRSGGRFIERAFGGMYSKKPNDTEMFIEMDNGASWQLLGSDNFDRHIGSNPIFVVISEWALCNPRAYAFLRPILRENGGAIIFITTFRGRNHAYQMFKQLEGNENWYLDIKTIRDTYRDDGTPIVSEADMEEERAEGMSEPMIRQEYYCDPMAVMEGAIYGAPMAFLETAKQIRLVAYDPLRPVWCIWSFAHYPVTISYVVVQPLDNGGCTILASNNLYYQDTTEAFSSFAKSNKYPIARHALYSGDDKDNIPDIFDQASIYGFYPDIVPEDEEVSRIAKTSLWLRASVIDSNQTTLLDSLRSYKHDSDPSGEETFSPDESMEYLVTCAEAAAIYQSSTPFARNRWSKGRNYRASDRMAI